MEKIIVRKASITDVDILLRFEQEIIASERPFCNMIQHGHIHYYDIKQMITDPNIELVVAESDHSVIGSGYARIENSKPFYKHRRHAYLGFMYVDKNHRGKGVNKKIIDTLRQWAISHNITEMILEVYSDNLAAIKAYEKAGFTKNILEMRLSLKEE